MTSSTYEARRRAELDHVITSLRHDIAQWEADAREGGPLEKHSSQIHRLALQLSTGADDLATLLSTDRLPADLVEQVLDLHHVWDFFRSKLVLRHLSAYRECLAVADELAWSCYRPALDAAGTVLKLPPLVFLNRNAAPFAVARGSDYRNLLPRDLYTRIGVEAVRQLPFPIIGVPWHQTQHLPGILAVAHEVGHHIEDDCQRTEALRTRLQDSGLAPDRVPGWENWLGEAFADVCASLACGPAYAQTLADATAVDGSSGAGADRYPPAWRRVQLCEATLQRRHLERSDHDQEAVRVVAAWTTGGYRALGGKTLRSVLSCPGAQDPGLAAQRLLIGLPSGASDVRAVLAAAATAFFEDPIGYDRVQVGRVATREVLALRPTGIRRGLADSQAGDQEDVAAGHALIRLLSEAHAAGEAGGSVRSS